MSNTNDFDPPETDLELDPDNGFEEFDNEKGKSVGSSWKNSPLMKFGLVGAAVLVVVAIVSLFGGNSTQTPPSVVGKGSGSGFKDTPGTKEVTPVMKEALEEHNQQVVENAQKTGTSAIATPIDPPKAILEVSNGKSQTEDPLLRWQQMQEERAKAQREQQQVQAQKPQTDPQRETRLNAMITSMTSQMGEVLGKDKDKKLQHMAVVSPAELLANNGQQVAGPGGDVVNANVSTTGEVAKPANIILAAGKVEYAQMMLEANSDIPGPVVALIASGVFKDGRLLGKFTRKEDYLVITFSTLVTKKGTSVPINAYAVDPQSSLTGVATDVDHRYWKRVILPAAAKFVKGLGEAYAQTTTSTTQNSTTTTTATTDLNTKQELGKAVSEGASSLGQIFDDEGKATEPLVIVAAGTPIGVLFMESVTDQSILKARAGVSNVSPGQQQSLQQQQGMQPQMQMYQGAMNPLQQLQYGLQNQQFMQQGTVTGNGNNTQFGEPTVPQSSGQ